MLTFHQRCLRSPSNHSHISPFLWPTGHANLPPTDFQVAGMDLSRDYAFLFEEALRKQRVKTRIDVFPGLPHGVWGFFSRKLSLQKTYRRTLTWAWHGCSRRVRRKSNAWETGNGLRNVISRELRIIGLRDHTIYSQFPTRRLESLMALIKWSRGVRSGAARDCGPIFTDLTRGRISRIGEVLWLHDQYLVTCRLVFQFKISLQTSEA